MRVVVIGCGRIGRAIVESLLLEKHDVLIIDENPDVVKKITDQFDVMAICSKGISHTTLLNAGVDKCDLFIAVTDSDESNMVSCLFAKTLGAKNTVARIRDIEYNTESIEYIKNQLGISLVINPEKLSANAIYNLLRLPCATNVETFSDRAFEMLELIVTESSPIINKTLINLRSVYSQNFLICAIKRNDKVIIPSGDTIIKQNDKISIIISKEDTQKLLKSMGFITKQAKNVMIIGASSIAYYLSSILSNQKFAVKIIEKDKNRSQIVAQNFPENNVIINGDGMSQSLLDEEFISSYDAVVSLTDKDEENVMISCYAKSKEVSKVIPKIKRKEILNIAKQLNLDTILSPQQEVADLITKHVRSLESESVSKMERFYSVLDGMAEMAEFKVLEDFGYTNVLLKDLHFYNNTLVVGIVRNGVSIIPNGNDHIEVGDNVIVVTLKTKLYDLNDVFKK